MAEEKCIQPNPRYDAIHVLYVSSCIYILELEHLVWLEKLLIHS